VGSTTIGSPIAFANAGTVEVLDGTLSFSGATYVRTAGSTVLDGCELASTTLMEPALRLWPDYRGRVCREFVLART